MKNLIIKTIALASLISGLGIFIPSTMAQAADARVINVINPDFSSGIQIGDVLNRTIAIEVSAPYTIAKTALPIKGEVRDGIELSGINVNLTEKSNKKIVTIALHYQVFASAAKPVVMQLPAETFTFSDGAKNLSIKVPVWHFWFSPLVAEGISNAKENLQPQFTPTLIDINAHQARFWLSLALLTAGLLGLIYINANQHWLPFMNGAFAQAHRSIKRLPSNEASEKYALVYMHQAFNSIYGANLFAREIEQFLAKNPKFNILRSEIFHFFEQSNTSFFASQSQHSVYVISGLLALSKRLRDCERGVK